MLVARDDELADLTAFCAGPVRWRWVQAEAFAGKTALLASFSLHPPADVDVAACFLRRTTGQAQANYALDVLSRQLGVHAEQNSYQSAPFLRERVDDFFDLLTDAARTCRQRGRRLLIVVDGLDEDQTSEPGLAVARWLPDAGSLPANAWLLVASRAGVPVPLANDHPLQRQVWPLAASEAASELQQLAEEEMADARRSGGLVYQLLGLLAAAIGGLTDDELIDLVHRHESPTVTAVEIKDRLEGALSRSVQAVSDSDEPTRTVRVFAHEMLLEHARKLYEADLPGYHALIDCRAEDYAQRGWPPDTPRYLLAPYGKQLADRVANRADHSALDRLATIATDPARHDRMEYTQGDAAALAEIAAAQQLLLKQAQPSLTYLGVLAVYRDRLAARNRAIPELLPALWVQLGRPQRALALARRIPDFYRQARALGEVAAALARAGQVERAAETAAEAGRVACRITNPDSQARALVAVAKALAGAAESDKDAARAVQLIAVVLTGTAWPEGLPVLTVLAPDAVEGIRKALQQERS